MSELEKKFYEYFMSEYFNPKEPEKIAKELAKIAGKEMKEGVLVNFDVKKGELTINHKNKLQKEITELKKQIANIKYLDREKVEKYLRLKFSYRYELETIATRDIVEAVKHICNLAIKPTREKIVGVLKDYYFEDEEDIKLFNQIATKILEDNK